MSEDHKKPADFDWVTARHECSLRSIFESLRLGIREDIEIRNSTLPDDPDTQELRITERVATIRIYWHDVFNPAPNPAYVEFKLEPHNISVTNQEGLLLEASLCLNDDGDCKLRVGGKEFDLWQVRRKALESLLFGPRA